MIKKLPILFFSLVFIYYSCGKDKTPTPPPTDPCAGVSITVQATKVDATAAGNNGTITITSPIGNGFTYSINNGTFGTAAVFNNLAAGNYTVVAKNSNGCTGTGTFAIVTDVCAGKTITVTSTAIVNATPCSTTNDGSIAVSAAGSTGFTYNINNGTFSANTTFNALAAGNYTIGAKDVDGCVRTGTFTVGARPAGPLFIAVRGVIQTSCVSCHSGASPSGGVSLSTDCDIVNKWDRIKARAVDGTPSFMPQGGQLPASEKAKITNWVNAGHKFTD
jgi:hypothetical protein